MTMTKPTSEQVTFLAAGSGAVQRTALEKFRDVVSVKDFGSVGDGVADYSAAMQAAMNASTGKRLHVPAGNYVVSILNGVSNVYVFGDGPGVSIITRKSAGTTNGFVSFASKTNVTIDGITFNGNKSAQTLGANSLQFVSCDNLCISHCGFTNAKASGGGYGSGLAIIDSTTQANGTNITVFGNRLSGNEGPAIYVNKTYYVTIESNFIVNGVTGIEFINFVFPPVQDVHRYCVISNNTIRSCTNSGIVASGYYEAGTSPSNQKYGPNVPASSTFTICGNVVADCDNYGIGFQGSDGVVSGNSIRACGSLSGGGGILMNCRYSVCNGNSIIGCTNYGIDAGGSSSITISGNEIVGTGIATATAGTDINCGGNVMSVTANDMRHIGTHATTGIAAFGIEGTLTGAFPLPNGQVSNSNINISSNSIFGNGTTSLGIYVLRNMDQVTLSANTVTAAALPYIIEVPNVVHGMNVDNSMYSVTGISVPSVTAASTMVIPDIGEKFIVSGTTTINSIRTYSSNVYNGRVRFVGALNHGSGYSVSNPPTVTFSGGGGSGLACDAAVSLDGTVVYWIITNTGSGYSSAPTPTITHNGGSGATCNPEINCINFSGREITLFFSSSVTVVDGSNLSLNGNYNAVSGSVLRLIGINGTWYEVSRS